jgi:hypothetical protein
MSWDSRRQKVVLFGGYDHATGMNLADTWELDEEGWREVKPDATLPPPRARSPGAAPNAPKPSKKDDP